MPLLQSNLGKQNRNRICLQLQKIPVPQYVDISNIDRWSFKTEWYHLTGPLWNQGAEEHGGWTKREKEKKKRYYATF